METSLQYSKELQTAVVIPAYQPSPHLVDLVKYLCDRRYTVVIVDDGSGSEYSSVWEEISSGAIIIHHPQIVEKEPR